jgi:hypothetical protein
MAIYGGYSDSDSDSGSTSTKGFGGFSRELIFYDFLD